MTSALSTLRCRTVISYPYECPLPNPGSVARLGPLATRLNAPVLENEYGSIGTMEPARKIPCYRKQTYPCAPLCAPQIPLVVYCRIKPGPALRESDYKPLE